MIYQGGIMSIKLIKKDVKEGKGKDSIVIGWVDIPQIMDCVNIDTLNKDIFNLMENHLSIEDLISSINYGLCVRYRSPLHRPESKINKKVNSAVIDVINSLIDDGQELPIILMAGKKHFTEVELTEMYNKRIARVA